MATSLDTVEPKVCVQVVKNPIKTSRNGWNPEAVIVVYEVGEHHMAPDNMELHRFPVEPPVVAVPDCPGPDPS